MVTVRTSITNDISLVCPDLEKAPHGMRESNPGPPALQTNTFPLGQGGDGGRVVVCWLLNVQASVSRGRICSSTFYPTQSQYTDTGPTSPNADPETPGAWQGSHWSANVIVTGMTRPRKNPGASGIRTRDLPPSRRTP